MNGTAHVHLKAPSCELIADSWLADCLLTDRRQDVELQPWAFLPPVYSICTAAGLWLVYSMAVYNENVTPLTSKYRRMNGSHYPPFISVAGNFPPASCVFSEVMNLAAFFGLLIAVLRYLQLKTVLHKSWLNFGSMLSFSIGCFGMTLIGNFQVFNQMMIHNVGTLMTFGLGCLFCWVQSYLTLKADLKNEGKRTAIARFVLSAIITLCIILKYSFIAFSHMYAARCQWVLVMFFLVFIGTFGIEFRHSSFAIMYTDTLRPPPRQLETYQESRQQLETADC